MCGYSPGHQTTAFHLCLVLNNIRTYCMQDSSIILIVQLVLIKWLKRALVLHVEVLLLLTTYMSQIQIQSKICVYLSFLPVIITLFVLCGTFMVKGIPQMVSTKVLNTEVLKSSIVKCS